MASIGKRGRGCYVVRWRTPDGSSRSKTLRREVDAKKFLISVEHSKDTNTYIDPIGLRSRRARLPGIAGWPARRI